MKEEPMQKGDDDADSSVLNHSFDDIIQHEETAFDKPRVEVALSWHNINIEALPDVRGCCAKKDPNAPRKQILNAISGCVLPGQFLSIIGASGAGKTTLLNHLSGRLEAANLIISGQIKVNGVPKE